VMPDREHGPPGKERPGAHHNAGPIRKSGPHQDHQPGPAYSRLHRQCGRYADAWRAGFQRGAVDALRVASRQLDDVDALAVLEALADRYRSDYGLCGGDG